jgi:uncharacterized membrane protein YeaQ/YmgE (transglycosylase-associated protein family)
MPVIAFIIIGLAAGFLATRLMKIEADLPTTAAIGVLGALIGGFVLWRAGRRDLPGRFWAHWC